MDHLSKLLLDDDVRAQLWPHVIQIVETYIAQIAQARVAPELDPGAIRSLLQPFDFEQAIAPQEAVDRIVEGLWRHQVHAPHPRYFGLFNPAPTTMSIVADTLVAAFNPQLAAWSHSPLAVEVELHVVRAFGSRFGYDPSQTGGTFTSGGAEANHTGLLTALVRAFPSFAVSGLRSLEAQPVFYVSHQSHHSFFKAARFCGLGTDAVREIAIDERLRMDVRALVDRIARDRAAGHAPFMIAATAGTTGTGIIDAIADLSEVAAREGLWFHVDAAWGGFAALVPELRSLLDGIERADSITFDAHKMFSVPMAAGLFLTRHQDILHQACRITTDYMPRDAQGLDVIDPYSHSIQWTRRFIGLKVFLSLAVAGWDGYAAAIRHQVAMGARLRQELRASGWQVINETVLPVVCFVDVEREEGRTAPYLEAIAREIVSSGKAWISTTHLDPDTPALRACITNYRTSPEDVRALVQALGEARMKLSPRS